MTDIALPTHTPASLRTMAGIEARRLARHPAFIVGTVLAFGILVLLFFIEENPHLGDLLSMPVIPAFFIGLTSLVATARLTRSTEATAEAIGTAPGTEGRRTAALALACLVPFAAGAAWIALLLALVSVDGAHPYEWWFGTMPDWQVWAILVALGPVACMGGGLLGVLTGRWLRFPGAAAVMVVVVVAIDMVGQMPVTYESTSELRLWVPWAMFHSGSESDGTVGPVRRQRRLLPGLRALPVRRRRALRHLARPHSPHGSAPYGDRRRGHRRSGSARTGHDRRQRRQPPLEADSLQDQQVMLVGWYLRRAIPWMALLGCCAAALLLIVALDRWPASALVLLPGVVATCAAAAAFCFDEVSLPVVEVTPRGGTWRRTTRLATAVVPLGVWTLFVLVNPVELPLDSAWWVVGAAAIALTVGVAALASRHAVASPGGSLASAVVMVVISPVVISAFLGWDSLYPIGEFSTGVLTFWLAVAGTGVLASLAALRPGVGP